ncbi:hypothetical protein M726_02155 [Neisseria gonorrhoeae ATL_2011_01_17]|nr:hypothetical protein M726_02155 [Neisseria gonorrhoeae ATL_2011_01_17]
MTDFKITVLSGMMGNGGNCVKNAVIPAQEGIRIHPHRNLHPVIPAKAGI